VFGQLQVQIFIITQKSTTCRITFHNEAGKANKEAIFNTQKYATTDRSAPAQDNILLMRITWNGCKRTRRWKASFPQDFTRYLLAQIRPASNASEDICSNSSDTKWIHNGKSSTFAFFRPRSKIRIFGSKTNASALECK